MKFGSLFSGIGGLDLGLEWAGMECAWQVEIDEYCQKVLHKHWPEVPKYKDVRDVGRENLKTVDLIVGGFPCQPYSTAGKQRGPSDDRNLWPEFIRVVRELRPHWVVGENVPPILGLYGDTILADMAAAGYSARPFVLPALAFDAPHLRRRVFFIGHTDNKSKPDGPFHDEKSGLSDVENAKREGLEGAKWTGIHDKKRSESNRWSAEPRLDRVAHGVPDRVDRLRGLGNAVVPQVAEWIGRRIIEFDSQG